MVLKCDYTQKDNVEGMCTEKMEEGENIRESNSQQELEDFLEYCRLRDSQFHIQPSQLKRERVIRFYGVLKKLAFVYNGKAILDIDEKKMKARLLFWGKSIILLPGNHNEAKSILLDLLKNFEVIYIEEASGGIHLCFEENLYDEILIKDETAALLKMEKIMRGNRM